MSQASHQGGGPGWRLRPLPPQRQRRRPRLRLRRPCVLAKRDRVLRPRLQGSSAWIRPSARALSLGVVVAGIVVALVGGLIFSYLAFSLSRARADTAQLIRIQKIQSNLLSADATATNAFLVGGLEPAAQRAMYDQALSSTSSLIVEAAQAQPADAAALSALNQQVASYAATIEQAREQSSRDPGRGPVPPQRQRRPAEHGIADSGQPRQLKCGASGGCHERAGGYVLPVISLLALVGVIVGQIWLARRFKPEDQRRDAGKCGRAARHHRSAACLQRNS